MTKLDSYEKIDDLPVSEKGPKTELTSRKTVMLILCLVNFTANSAYSSIAPFYPGEAVKKGVDEAFIGLIFAGYSTSIFLFSPLFGYMLNKIGRKKVLMIGCLCQGIAMLCFTIFIYVENPYAFGIISFFIRFTEGFGNGCINSSSSSIISHSYPDNMSNLIGLIQTFTGLGMLAGPLIGSMLYEVGGFQLPFFCTGGLLLTLVFLAAHFVPNDVSKEFDDYLNEDRTLV
jgi:MFS family permease